MAGSVTGIGQGFGVRGLAENQVESGVGRSWVVISIANASTTTKPAQPPTRYQPTIVQNPVPCAIKAYALLTSPAITEAIT